MNAPSEPSTALELRSYLPAIEPDRQITDWGRSERVEGVLDRTVVDFLYHYWFRCEVDGIEHVPAAGGALLLANHAGALPPDAAMIAKAIKEEHPRPRPLHLTVDRSLWGLPFLSMVLSKVGGVQAHPANVHRLLHDEGELVLDFPEGRAGNQKLFKDRYRLGSFGQFVPVAQEAGVPIVPVAVIGAEEAMPAFARIDLLRRLSLPWAFGYLPAKFHIRFLEPVTAGEDAADDVRERIEDALEDMLANRGSVWLG